MEQKKPEPRTVCDKVIKIFLNQLAALEGLEDISNRLEKVILDGKPSEIAISSALFDEEVS